MCTFRHIGSLVSAGVEPSGVAGGRRSGGRAGGAPGGTGLAAGGYGTPGHRLASDVAACEAVADGSGRVLYHVVALESGGFVIVAADDNLEPVVAFSERGRTVRAFVHKIRCRFC